MGIVYKRAGRCALIAAACWLSLACDSDSVEMRLLVYDHARDTYVFDTVEVKTLNNIKRLDGEATVVKGGLSIVIDYRTNELSWKELGHPVIFSAIEEDGVLVPESYDALAMASVYYSMELSYLFFLDALGVDEALLTPLPTYYKPHVAIITAEGERLVEEDNAFYMNIADDEQAFFVVNHRIFQWIPMALNSGIITHEYTHYLFNTLVSSKSGDLTPESGNFLLSVNEGTADFMATVRTEDPRFMSHSIPQGYYAVPKCNGSTLMELSRDISEPERRNYNRAMDLFARTTVPADFCPYEIGLVWAAMLYEMATAVDGAAEGEPPSRASLVKVALWLVAALAELGEHLKGRTTFEIWEIISIFINKIDSLEEKQVVCDIVRKRYAMYFDEVDGC